MSLGQAQVADTNLLFRPRSEFLLSAALLAVLVVLLVPLPPPFIDLLLATNLAWTLLVLLVTLAVRQPLDFAVFPSVLLLLTLARLALNVATTRQILLQADAGKIVAAFGHVVVGGNLVVGLVVFLILVVIQFVVITRGAGRISEVAARFTLDALPGKQMAVDAELNAGLIDEAEARRRRAVIVREAEFYGAMDGASKFVRGDAIAGLVITAINLLGGIVMGMARGMTLSDALFTYSVLTVGDGLVSQIPALVTATAAGMLITKASTAVGVAQELAEQLFLKPRQLLIGATLLGFVALVPGLPKIPFLALAGLLAWASRYAAHQTASQQLQRQTQEKPKSTVAAPEVRLEELIQQDRLCVEIGARLIPLVDPRRGTGLLDRIAALRRDMARKHGILVPPIRIRDNLDLPPNTYRLLLHGQEMGRFELLPDMSLAIESSPPKACLEASPAREPAFGLPAYWIPPSEAQRAELLGYMVVDPATVLVTHLGELIRRHAHELLGREDLKKLIDKVKETSPSLVEELIPGVLSMGVVHQVLCFLLEEQVPITQLTRILESLAVHGSATKDPHELVERVRVDLGRAICERFRRGDHALAAIVLDPRVELYLKRCVRDRQLLIEPRRLERLIEQLADALRKSLHRATEICLVVDKSLRKPLRNLIVRALPELPVVAYSEIPKDLRLEPVAVVTAESLEIAGVDTELAADIERLLYPVGEGVSK